MDLQADIAKIGSELERRNDAELIKVIYGILELNEKNEDPEVNETTRKRLVDQALRAEEEIKQGKGISPEEARRKMLLHIGR